MLEKFIEPEWINIMLLLSALFATTFLGTIATRLADIATTLKRLADYQESQFEQSRNIIEQPSKRHLGSFPRVDSKNQDNPGSLWEH